jgi:hypothetical protein
MAEPSDSTGTGTPSNQVEPRPRARLAEEVQVLELPPREANGEQYDNPSLLYSLPNF